MQEYITSIRENASWSLRALRDEKAEPEPSVDFSKGEVRLPLPQWLRDLLKQAAGETPLSYPSPQGLAGLRQAYAQFLQQQGYSVDEQHVLITAGAKEALWLAMASVVAPGMTILLPQPGWPWYVGWTKALGAQALVYTPDSPTVAEDLIALIHKYQPGVVLLNFPHNPTGAEISREGIKQIQRAAAQTKATIISDEVYRCFALSPQAGSLLDAFPQEAEDVGTIYIDSVSKVFGLAGLRVGFLVASPWLVKRVMALRASLATGTSTLSQTVVEAVLRAPRAQEWRETIAERNRAALHCTATALLHAGYQVASTGAFYVWLPYDGRSSGLSQDRIIVGTSIIKGTPGALFGTPNYLRLCPLRPRSLLQAVFQTCQ